MSAGAINNRAEAIAHVLDRAQEVSIIRSWNVHGGTGRKTWTIVNAEGAEHQFDVKTAEAFVAGLNTCRIRGQQLVAEAKVDGRVKSVA